MGAGDGTSVGCDVVGGAVGEAVGSTVGRLKDYSSTRTRRLACKVKEIQIQQCVVVGPCIWTRVRYGFRHSFGHVVYNSSSGQEVPCLLRFLFELFYLQHLQTKTSTPSWEQEMPGLL